MQGTKSVSTRSLPAPRSCECVEVLELLKDPPEEDLVPASEDQHQAGEVAKPDHRPVRRHLSTRRRCDVLGTSQPPHSFGLAAPARLMLERDNAACLGARLAAAAPGRRRRRSPVCRPGPPVKSRPQTKLGELHEVDRDFGPDDLGGGEGPQATEVCTCEPTSKPEASEVVAEVSSKLTSWN